MDSKIYTPILTIIKDMPDVEMAQVQKDALYRKGEWVKMEGVAKIIKSCKGMIRRFSDRLDYPQDAEALKKMEEAIKGFGFGD